MSITKSTIVVYPYSSETRELTIPFDYLKRDFVIVSLEGKGKQQKSLSLGIDYRFTTKTTITVIRRYEPTEGYTKIAIRRVTDASKRIINYQDGSILNALELNTSQLQALHVAEEARDLTAYTLFVNNDGDLDARGRIIRNLGDPLNPQDAVTKKYVDTASESVINSRDRAETAASKAEGYRDEAVASRDFISGSLVKIEDHLVKADDLNTQAVANSSKALEAMIGAQRSSEDSLQFSKNARDSAAKAKKSEDATRALLSSVTTCKSIAELKTIEPITDGQVINVTSYYEGGVSGGGQFFYDETDKSSQEDGGLVIIQGGVNRWKRIVHEAINVKDFGAKGNGVDDDTVYIQNALNSCKSIEISTGTYNVSKTLTIRSDTTIIGINLPTIKMTAVNTTMFKSEEENNISYKGIKLEGYGKNDTASCANRYNGKPEAQAIGIWFDSGINLTVENCIFINFKNNAVRASYSSNVYIRNNTIKGTHPDPSIPVGSTSVQQFGVIIHADSAAQKGRTMEDVIVNKSATMHNCSNINITNNFISDTAIAMCVYPAYSNVTIDSNKTFGTLTQHSIYCYAYKNLNILNNIFEAEQQVGVKISNYVQACYYIPSDITIRNNVIENTASPSISLEVFDKDNEGSYQPAASSAYFKNVFINSNVIRNTTDSCMALAVGTNVIITNNTIDNSNVTSSSPREVINLRGCSPLISNNSFKDCSDSILGGSPSVYDDLTFTDNIINNAATKGGKRVIETTLSILPFGFKEDRPINWYATGSIIRNTSTDDVYEVIVGGVAKEAPTGRAISTSGECSFKYLFNYSTFYTKVFVRNNIIKETKGITTNKAISFNNSKFSVSMVNNYADPSINTIAVQGVIIENIGNNFSNPSKVAFKPNQYTSGTAGNFYVMSEIPRSGTYEKGDIIYHPDPQAIKAIGWVCTNRNPTNAGSTWVKFGGFVVDAH